MAAIQRTDPVGYTVAIIDRLVAAQREKEGQQAIINEATQRLKAADVEVVKAFRELHEELTRMDVAQSGNRGWEHRMARFLMVLRTHGVAATPGIDPAEVLRLAEALEKGAEVRGTVHQQADWQRIAQRQAAGILRGFVMAHTSGVGGRDA